MSTLARSASISPTLHTHSLCYTFARSAHSLAKMLSNLLRSACLRICSHISGAQLAASRLTLTWRALSDRMKIVSVRGVVVWMFPQHNNSIFDSRACEIAHGVVQYWAVIAAKTGSLYSCLTLPASYLFTLLNLTSTGQTGWTYVSRWLLFCLMSCERWCFMEGRVFFISAFSRPFTSSCRTSEFDCGRTLGPRDSCDDYECKIAILILSCAPSSLVSSDDSVSLL